MINIDKSIIGLKFRSEKNLLSVKFKKDYVEIKVDQISNCDTDQILKDVRYDRLYYNDIVAMYGILKNPSRRGLERILTKYSYVNFYGTTFEEAYGRLKVYVPRFHIFGIPITKKLKVTISFEFMIRIICECLANGWNLKIVEALCDSDTVKGHHDGAIESVINGKE